MSPSCAGSLARAGARPVIAAIGRIGVAEHAVQLAGARVGGERHGLRPVARAAGAVARRDARIAARAEALTGAALQGHEDAPGRAARAVRARDAVAALRAERVARRAGAEEPGPA